MNKFIYSEEELRKFYDNVLPPLTNTEVYFVSLSARNKLLSEEEKLEYSLGRTEMFERKTIREKDWNKFYRSILKYETNEGAYTGRNGKPLPKKCTILYININPSDMVKAYQEFDTRVRENIYNMISNKGSNLSYFKKIDRELMNAIQRNKGTKHYIDIDFDLPDKVDGAYHPLLYNFIVCLQERNQKFFVVETRGGFHVLLSRETLNFNFNKDIEYINEVAKSHYRNGEKFEICRNVNDMIPLPGTLQGVYPVKVHYDWSNYDIK